MNCGVTGRRRSTARRTFSKTDNVFFTSWNGMLPSSPESACYYVLNNGLNRTNLINHMLSHTCQSLLMVCNARAHILLAPTILGPSTVWYPLMWLWLLCGKESCNTTIRPEVGQTCPIVVIYQNICLKKGWSIRRSRETWN